MVLSAAPVTSLARAVRDPRTAVARAWGLAVETEWGLAHVGTYLWGLGNEHVSTVGSYREHRTERLSLGQRGLLVSDTAASSMPVLPGRGRGGRHARHPG